MSYLRWLGGEVVGVVWDNKRWMVWNLVLAFVAAGLSSLLFHPRRRRTLAWWSGLLAFVLFLPNAPYVVTDLIHLRDDISTAASDGVVLAGVLPLYAAFVLAGYLAYRVCMVGIIREVRTVRPGTPEWAVELPVHLVCAVGIVLGRLARLNSWDTVTTPVGTLEETFETLSWRGAPFAVVAVFVAVWLTYTVVKLVVDATVRWVDRRVGALDRRRTA